MSSDSTPRSLAALYAQRRKSVRAAEPEKGQMGLLFTAQDEASSPATAPSTETPASLATPTVEEPQQPRVWSVASLVSELRGYVEKRYASAWVEGEVSNCRLAPSGHLYFTLKDGDAQLPVVMFRRQASLLRFTPQDGHAVLVRGNVSVYESRGQLQLIAESLEPRGEGALRLAYEELRRKLMAEGLFDEERKRALPPYPKTIGIVTSPTGAVLRDMANITRRRHHCLNLLVYPALMQGTDSAADVKAGIAYFNSHTAPPVDVIVVARGGGSAEDLWGFNDESLARTIASSRIPIVSAIGHETDFTIADFVADLRAPTPSAAAEILTEGYVRAQQHLVAMESRVVRGIRYQLMQIRQRLTRMDAGSILSRTRHSVERRQQHIDTLRFRLESATQALLQQRHRQLAVLERRLAQQHIAQSLHTQHIQWSQLHQRMERSLEPLLRQLRSRYERAHTRLTTLDPTAVLERGYALVFTSNGDVVRSAHQLQPGDTLIAQLAKGRVRAQVTGEEEE